MSHFVSHLARARHQFDTPKRKPCERGDFLNCDRVETEIVVPDEIAVMTLPNVAFFPQALMPLHIFEPRYRQMLSSVLSSHRIFAVAGLHPDSDPSEERGQRIATAGIVRACNQNDDGTSNLLLQGLTRVKCEAVVQEEPYRVIRIKTLSSETSDDEESRRRLRTRIQRLLTLRRQLGAPSPEGFTQFLKSVEDSDAFIDLAAFTLCENPALKQRLLETLNVEERLRIYGDSLRHEVERLSVEKKLQGRLPDEDLGNN
ncbi:MAG: LON peptidase substrate-binding domain-containing protein [Synoicihabitans sp.]